MHFCVFVFLGVSLIRRDARKKLVLPSSPSRLPRISFLASVVLLYHRPGSFLKLHKSETGLFFPWLREYLPKEVLPPLEEFDREREAIVRIGNNIGKVDDGLL